MRTRPEASKAITDAVAAPPAARPNLLSKVRRPGARGTEKHGASRNGKVVLQLDPGGHRSVIRRLAFSADGKFLVSAGEDKVIRVWNWRTGKTVRTIRGQVGLGHEGKIYALALSADGKWLAVGGWLSGTPEEISAIRLYDFVTGRLVALLKGHTNVVLSLAFSPSGDRLLSGSADKSALLWDIERKKAVYALLGHQDHVYAVAFTPDGKHAVTGSLDHEARLWRVADGQPAATLNGHNDMIVSLAVSSNGTIATGDWSGEIRLWNGGTGEAVTPVGSTFADQQTVVGSLSFSPDGRRLISTSANENGPYDAHVWEVATGRKLLDYAGHDDVVLGSAVSPDGRYAVTGGGSNRAIHFWDIETGHLNKALAGVGTSIWAVGMAEDGRSIAWGRTRVEDSPTIRGPLEFKMGLPGPSRSLGTPRKFVPGDAARFTRARDKGASRSLSRRRSGRFDYHAILDIEENGDKRPPVERGPTAGYAFQSYTLTPDDKAIIAGGMNGVLTALGAGGQRVGRFVGHEGDVWAVATDGKLLVSGSFDQTVRVWSLETRELIATLFHGRDDEWVMWTPQGYYTSSIDGDALVGWQINQGVDKAAYYVTAQQLRRHLHSPEIVAEALRLGSAEKAARRLRGDDPGLETLLEKKPPEFRIVEPETGARVAALGADITVDAPSNVDEKTEWRIYVNDRRLPLATTRAAVQLNQYPNARRFRVPLETGRNRIRVVARNWIGESLPQEIVIQNDGKGGLQGRGKLYILAVGVNTYPKAAGRLARLAFAAKDACVFARRAAAVMGPRHKGVVTRLLASGDCDGLVGRVAPTRENIIDEVSALRKARAEDTVVVFLAGHGVKLPGRNQAYRFMPSDAAIRDDGWRDSTLVKWSEISGALSEIAGRRLLFVDTCHARGAFNERLVDVAKDSVIVFSATDEETLAIEDSALGHGVFTFALKEGLGGKADLSGEREIDLVELGVYVRRIVRSYSAEQQVPKIYNPNFDDFVLGRVE